MTVTKKKLLIRIGSLRHGGAEKALITFLKNIPENKFEIDLLLNLNSGVYLSEVPSWIKVYHIFNGEMITTNRLQDIPEKAYRVITQKLLLKFPKLLYKFILKNKKYDIELAAIQGMAEEILSSPIKTSKKVVWIQNDVSKVPGYNKEKIKRFFNFDKILAISEAIQKVFDDLAENLQQKEKIVKIFNPIDTAKTREKATVEISDFPFNHSFKTFISVGTIYPQKGYDRLIKVHKKLLLEGLKHNIIIVGDGFDAENIKNLALNEKVSDSIAFLGFLQNPYSYIKKSDFYIQSSRHEGYPTILFEALALQKPIIATNVSGANEMLLNGKLGMVIDNSEEGIYQGMKTFLTHAEIPDNYVKEIKNTELPFTLENSVKKLIEVLDF